MRAVPWLGTFGGRRIIEGSWDSSLVVVIALAVCYWGERSGVRLSGLVLCAGEDEFVMKGGRFTSVTDAGGSG